MNRMLGLDPVRTRIVYERDAERYLRSLPLGHFMESTAQSTQSKIAEESFDVIQMSRPDIQCFSELLIQYPVPGQDPAKPARVVPDNMVFVHSEPIEADRSYMMPLQPVGPYVVMEYLSKGNERKDYVDSRKKYEHDLKVPFYLLFHPDKQELTLFRLERKRYVAVKPNAAGRLPIPKLDLEVANLDGWMRFWFRGERVPLPGDLLKQVREKEKQLATSERKARTAKRRADAAEQRAAVAEAELARLREELARTARRS